MNDGECIRPDLSFTSSPGLTRQSACLGTPLPVEADSRVKPGYDGWGAGYDGWGAGYDGWGAGYDGSAQFRTSVTPE